MKKSIKNGYLYGEPPDETAIVLAHFGTSVDKARKNSLSKIDKDMALAFPNRKIIPTFISERVREILKERDGEVVLSPEEALEQLAKSGVARVLIVPTVMIPGLVYEQILELKEKYNPKFKGLAVTKAFLSDERGFNYIVNELHDLVSHDMKGPGAFLLMGGHGSPHDSSKLFTVLNETLRRKGDVNVFISCIEGEPSFGKGLKEIIGGGYRVIMILPLMVAAGEHVSHDLFGEDNGSWENTLIDMGFKTATKVIGLGEFPNFRKIFVDMAKESYRELEDSMVT